MLRRHHRFFQSLQVLRDAVLSVVAFGAAYLIRFYTDLFTGLTPHSLPSPREESLAMLVMVLLVWPAVGWACGLYVSRRARSMVAEVFDVFRVTLAAFLVLVTLTYFLRDERYSRATLILWTFLCFGLISLARVTSRALLRGIRRQGFNLRHVLVVGVEALAQQVSQTIRRESALGMRVVGHIAADGDRHRVGAYVAGVPVVGTVSDLAGTLPGLGVDQVIVALPIDKLQSLKGIMDVLSQETVDVRLIPDVYQYVTLCGSVEEFSGLPIINLQATPLLGWNLVSKRIFDVLMAGVALVLSAPVMMLVAALTWLTSGAPVFFRQERVGMDGRRFMMYKFRTMRVDSEGDSTWTVAEDPRRTQLGCWLRRTSLDELPQLFNVLLGDMSLVGPRPEQPRYIETFKREIPRYALRHKIKAGMTGWAQVNGMRGNTSISKRIELDLYYIENWSLLLDVKILLRTIFGGFISPHAY